MPENPITDDEAFVRAIVAAPADEAPRLVYADWLDERGDPRGAYLRAEVEFFRQGGPGLPKKSIHEWVARWKGVDSTWAHRVTRPPIGVCCAHIRFSHSGPASDREALDRIQARLQVKLPPAYRAFLLNWNGGIPDPKRFQADNHTIPELAIRFYPAVEESSPPRPAQRYHGDLIQATEALYSGRFVPRGPRRMIPTMAATYPTCYLIGTVGARLGGIYRCIDLQLEGGTDPTKVSESLPAFLMRFAAQS